MGSLQTPDDTAPRGDHAHNPAPHRIRSILCDPKQGAALQTGKGRRLMPPAQVLRDQLG